MIYAGFWRRLGANVIDGIVTLPLVFVFEWGSGISQQLAIYLAIPYALIYSLYRFYFHAKWGATLGKRALKIEVVRYEDEFAISYLNSAMRVSVDTIFAIVLGLASIYAINSLSADVFLALDWSQRSSLPMVNGPTWYDTSMIALCVWSAANAISLLFTQKKRALHDIIGATVVVHKKRVS